MSEINLKINLMKQKEGEEQKVIVNELNAVQFSMDSNNMLKDQTVKTDMMISYIKGEILYFIDFFFPLICRL